jgi:acetylornithine deacetylase
VTAERLLPALVAIPSVSRDEQAVADLLSSELAAAGVAVSRAGNNLWFEIGRGRPRLLLVSHLDTVPAGDGWTVDPHAARWDDERLVGLGANDAKGCVAAMAEAALALAAGGAPPLGSVVFAFTAEEEVGGGNGISALRPLLGEFDAAVIGEPTGLDVCVAQRGLVILRCVARGRSAHAAHVEGGVNAVHAAAADIVRLAGMRFGDHPLLGATSPQVTRIGAGGALNQVPAACEFFVDLRVSPGVTADAVVARLRGELASDVAVHSARYPPCSTDAAHPLVQAALAAAGRSRGTGSRTTSDWVFLSDLPAVKVGPGDTRRSHGPDEYLTRSELEAGVAFYRRLVPECLARLGA